MKILKLALLVSVMGVGYSMHADPLFSLSGKSMDNQAAAQKAAQAAAQKAAQAAAQKAAAADRAMVDEYIARHKLDGRVHKDVDDDLENGRIEADEKAMQAEAAAAAKAVKEWAARHDNYGMPDEIVGDLEDAYIANDKTREEILTEWRTTAEDLDEATHKLRSLESALEPTTSDIQKERNNVASLKAKLANLDTQVALIFDTEHSFGKNYMEDFYNAQKEEYANNNPRMAVWKNRFNDTRRSVRHGFSDSMNRMQQVYGATRARIGDGYGSMKNGWSAFKNWFKRKFSRMNENDAANNVG